MGGFTFPASLMQVGPDLQSFPKPFDTLSASQLGDDSLPPPWCVRNSLGFSQYEETPPNGYQPKMVIPKWCPFTPAPQRDTPVCAQPAATAVRPSDLLPGAKQATRASKHNSTDTKQANLLAKKSNRAAVLKMSFTLRAQTNKQNNKQTKSI